MRGLLSYDDDIGAREGEREREMVNEPHDDEYSRWASHSSTIDL